MSQQERTLSKVSEQCGELSPAWEMRRGLLAVSRLKELPSEQDGTRGVQHKRPHRELVLTV